MKFKLLIGFVSTVLVLFGCAPKTFMVEFPEEPCLTPETDTSFTLCKDFNFKVDRKPYLVPKGFHTELSSIPKVSWHLYLAFQNKYLSPGIVHDFMYECKNPFNRLEADSILYNGLLVEGADEKRAKLFYYTVSAIGWNFYSADKQCLIRK